MNNSVKFIKLCRFIFVLMLIHVIGAVIINWMYNIITEHYVSHPFSQLAHIFLYLPVWIGIELYRQYLDFINADKLVTRITCMIISCVLVIVNIALICMNLWALEYGFMPFLGSLLTSLFSRCWFYLPSILMTYLISWILRL